MDKNNLFFTFENKLKLVFYQLEHKLYKSDINEEVIRFRVHDYKEAAFETIFPHFHFTFSQRTHTESET